ncbi:uncharacterized protein Gasu_12590 [Galdieria sulphuraria]|uniref:Sucrose phosphatase-like domain-containing protein n=1 Tax=Galdieria sulphuraria TaxID=130081 RepID=M2Y6C9_GALSU|nr:uncharacterized protein Gasu_12590 [Galdieria sulphuraria]EME31588.1 hypothetical protein Gasu_12590 [Galdieria sulphuraria]|eukprot:XP_005708108.1 hypothetical protein Gasu_12590 [Galdieria sulphuraria]
MEISRQIRIVFSDLDGTLVHYPQELKRYSQIEQLNDGKFVVRYKDSGEERICLALPSTTRGYSLISLETCQRIEEIREKGVYFVYISGARTVTFENRRSLLPIVDFEVFENGGVITQQGKVDQEWQQTISSFIGSNYSLRTPVEERQGSLWDAYRLLLQKGFKLDADGYLTQFRVKKPQGNTELDKEWSIMESEIQQKLNVKVVCNLNELDVIPSIAGKENAAKHILKKLQLDTYHTAFL